MLTLLAFGPLTATAFHFNESNKLVFSCEKFYMMRTRGMSHRCECRVINPFNGNVTVWNIWTRISVDVEDFINAFHCRFGIKKITWVLFPSYDI